VCDGFNGHEEVRKMSGEELDLNVEGPAGAISAQSIHEILGATLTVLDGAAAAVELSAKPDWKITAAAVGSVHLAMSAPGTASVTSLMIEGLETLRHAPRIPPRWTQRMVRAARTLGRKRGDVSHVTVAGDERSVTIDSQVAANADRALSGRDVSLGSILGRVDTWSDRSQPRIGMTRDIDGEPVAVTFPPKLQARVLSEALGNRIEANGELRRNSAGQLVKLHMTDFKVIQSSDALPTSEIVGLWSDVEWQPMTTEEWAEHRGRW
jgi:hypothetical protein